jgi:hypothetical protein
MVNVALNGAVRVGDGRRNFRRKFTEETMRKSLILPLIAIGGGASYAAGVTEVATGPIRDDPSTWRWQVTSILAEQSDTTARRVQTAGVLDADVFNQRYERFTPLGMPQARGDSR